MRIDRLEIENFKCFAKQTITLHPQFTLFIGENGSGKTSVLDALAVAASIWLVAPPDSTLNGSRRQILENEIRLDAEVRGDRTQFVQRRPVSITTFGTLNHVEGQHSWVALDDLPSSAQNVDIHTQIDHDWVVRTISQLYENDRNGGNNIFPVLAYYGAGRAWSPHRIKALTLTKENSPARRWAAFRNCLSGDIDTGEFARWFARETTARGSRGGQWRPGFQVVLWAILNCVPGATNAWYDVDCDDVVLSIGGRSQPFRNLSSGQRMMMALVADVAIKIVTQNAFLLPPNELGENDKPVPQVLRETPGLVLIDELDVHLHPRWQRHVAADLKATFPKIQFVCTSHSPQVIGELKPEEIRMLSSDEAVVPPRSFGVDSNRVLEELMGAPSRDEYVSGLLRRLFDLIDREDFESAHRLLAQVEPQLGQDDPEITRARALMAFLQAPM